MRTRPIGALAALIAVVALVALAGPAETRTPGAAAGPAQRAFTPLVLEPIDAAEATDTTSAAPLDAQRMLGARALVDPGAVNVPTRGHVVELPAVALATVAKPAPRRAAAAAATTTSASGSGWRTAEYSWYGPGLYGNGTACGQTLTRSLLGVAHRSLPCGTRVTLRNPANGRTITVRVVDRGPYVAGRTWDLTSAACNALNACHTGRIQWRVP